MSDIVVNALHVLSNFISQYPYEIRTIIVFFFRENISEAQID